MSENKDLGTIFSARNGFRFILYSVDEARQKPERKAVIKNYFYENTLNLIYGSAGSMKTWWCLYEAVCLVVGRQLLGLDIEKDTEGRIIPHRVLYVSLEMMARDIADRIEELTADLNPIERDQIARDLHIVSFEDNSGMLAGNDGFIKALGDLCQNQNYDVIFIDSFSDYVAGFDQRSEDHMRKVINDLRRFTVDYGVSFRIIHHGTKTYSDGTGGSMAGIHTIRDLADHVFLIKQNKDELTITSDPAKDPSAKTRYKKPITLIAGVKSDGESYFSFYRKSENETNSNIEIIGKILQAVKDQQGITAGELKNILGKSYTDIRDGMVGTQLVRSSGRSESGQQTARFYTVDYYQEHEDEIKDGETGKRRGKTGIKPS